MFFNRSKSRMISADEALPGRGQPAYEIPERHTVLGTPIQPPFPEGMEVAYFGLGCFWGAERLFWKLDGVYTTASGYQGGFTPNPTYQEVCSGRTGHAEAVMVVFDPAKISYEELLRVFFEAHDPTQGMRQGNDVGSQYRSAIYTTSEAQSHIAAATKAMYNSELQKARHGEITTEIAPAGPFYYAEEYHQQYLDKVPNGYCGLAGTGVTCPIPAAVSGGSGTETDTGLKQIPTSEDEWKRILSREEYAVLRQAGTERPFTGEYVDTEDDGIYRCRACGNILFESDTKYHSGCGWPSFTETVSPDAVELLEDRSHGMVRTEVRCARCHSHLGHVFNDGPIDRGGQRYCMNSVSLTLEEQ
ncbi:MAG TPA: peptide-methionine (S)-S-oxide reductase MsrA [Thermomicrobiales bacterium]|nr:peptide-methionine (S)-S-oxide reductase MsrA [Thermomicrobiales bacterium]